MNFESARGVAAFAATQESEPYAALAESAARSRDQESPAHPMSFSGLVPGIPRRLLRLRFPPRIRGVHSSLGLRAPAARTRPPPRVRLNRPTGHAADRRRCASHLRTGDLRG